MSKWSIQLAGALRIQGPEGREVAIASRKGRALFGLLVLNQGIAVSRAELAAQLWPDKPTGKQLQSLRQSIKELRAAFEPVEVLESSRDTCRLSLADWTCDAVDCIVNGTDLQGPLLPEMTEPIFERWRAEMSALSPSGEWTYAARGASDIAFWLRTHHPDRLLDHLYGCRELLPYIGPTEVEALVRAAIEGSPDHPRLGWGHIQLAQAMLWQGKQREGIAQAKRALLTNEPAEDAFYWASGVFAAATFLMFRGRFGKALSLLSAALEVAAQASNSRSAVDRLNHSIAHCHAYRGDLTTALRIMSEMDDTIVEPAAAALRNAHRAVYSLLDGRMEDAEHFLFRAKSQLVADMDVLLKSQVRLAEALLLMAQNHIGEAREVLLELEALMVEFGIPLVRIHALESLALVAETPGERERYWGEARRHRQEHGLPLLPLDRQRLRALLES